MNLELSGQVAAVVGGTRGLGHAIAAAFRAEGADVAVVDPDAGIPALAAAIPGGAAGFVGDVTDHAAMKAIAGSIRGLFGRCDHLVLAAGIGSGKLGFPFWNLDLGNWDRVLRIILIGAENVANAFAPAMAESGSGTILFHASVAGQIGSPAAPTYSASKAGLINFAQCAAKDLAPHGVRVNTLNRGMVQATLTRSAYESWAAGQVAVGGTTPTSHEEWGGAQVQTLIPRGGWQTPEDVAAMAVFLAPRRAANVTGQTINIDGGYMMHW